MEEYLRSKEAFVANVHLERLLSNRVHALKLLNPFTEIVVVLAEFLDDVGTDVAISLLRQDTNLWSTKHKRSVDNKQNNFKLRRFALRFIHLYSDATGKLSR